VQEVPASGGQLQLVLGCNVNCSVSLSGTLQRGSQTYALTNAAWKLEASHSQALSLELPPGAALSGARAEITVLASAPGQPTRTYRTHVRLAAG
jgi:hypothetical protein